MILFTVNSGEYRKILIGFHAALTLTFEGSERANMTGRFCSVIEALHHREVNDP